MGTKRIGILGCGGFAGAHARRLKAVPEVRIAALADVAKEKIDGLIQRRLQDYSPAPAIYTDPERMFREAELDGVVIVTPHSMHFTQAMRAMDAGCHVLVEKPMVLNAREAATLAGKSGSCGRKIVVGYNPPYTAAFQYLRQVIHEGRLGRLQLVNGYISQNWKKLTAGSWRQDPALSGGGQAFDSGAHLLAGICWAVGASPEEVFALIDRQDTKVDINAVVTARFAGGVMASVAVGGDCLSDGTHSAYLFEGGKVEIDGWGGQWVRAFRGNEALADTPSGGVEPAPDGNFVDVLYGRAEPVCTVDDGLRMAQLMDALYESARTGKPAKVE
jgi:predicted dehydrogenase